MKGLANANTEIIAFEVGVQKKTKFVIFLIFENMKELKGEEILWVKIFKSCKMALDS